jgi:hypothetical protein
MTNAASWGAFAAILVLGAQPCVAAEDFKDREQGERRTAAFAGATLKMNFGQRSNPKPEARLQLGMRHNFEGSPAAARQVALVELGEGRTGKPAVYVAGQDAGQVEQKLAVKGTTGNVLIGVAIGVALLVVIAFASMDDDKLFDWDHT